MIVYRLHLDPQAIQRGVDTSDLAQVRDFAEIKISQMMDASNNAWRKQSAMEAENRALAADLRFLKNELRELRHVKPLPPGASLRRWLRYIVMIDPRFRRLFYHIRIRSVFV